MPSIVTSGGDKSPEGTIPLDSVIELVSRQAKLNPEAVALRSATTTVSYGQLDLETDQLAGYLNSRGVGSEVVVGVCMDRSPAMVVAALAIMKAGGAYLPLDPSYPKARIEFMLRDARTTLVITSTNLSSQIPEGSWQVVSLNDISRPVTSNDKRVTPSAQADDSLAYIIYTSGSTGQPKGVQVTQKSLLNLVSWHVKTFAVTSTDRASQLSSIGFDAAVWEVWPYLTTGASVHFVDEEARMTAEALRNWLLSHDITIGFVPTILAEQLIKLEWPGNAALRIMLTGADTLHHYPPDNLPFSLVNNYGPTECTVVASSGEVSPAPGSGARPTIGRPIYNAQIYILDEDLKKVPAGSVGELYVGGAGLARGYVNRPDLDRERFILNPFSPIAGERLYKTGDLARYLADGEIEFVGRADDQIKLRGYRIEPNEIVTALQRHSAVSASAIVAREDAQGNKTLVAYVVPSRGAEFNPQEMHSFLRKHLPDYMVPGIFVCLDQLPTLPSGKLNRAALPEPASAGSIEGDTDTAPRRMVEKRLGALLKVLLGVKQINAGDNFFLLGGHSLLGAQLIAQIRDAFGVELPLRSIFDFPTVAELSTKVEALIAEKINAMTPEQVEQALANSGHRETLR